MTVSKTLAAGPCGLATDSVGCLAARISAGEFMPTLRASKYASIPVLILSGSHSNNEIEYDPDAFEIKPVEATRLVACR